MLHVYVAFRCISTTCCPYIYYMIYMICIVYIYIYIYTIQTSLEVRGLINWWTKTCWRPPVCAGPVPEMAHLYALDTEANGDCLPHALSIGLGGFHDRLLTLRAALHHTVSSMFCVL